MNYLQVTSVLVEVEKVYDSADFRETMKLCDELLPIVDTQDDSMEWSTLRARLYFLKASSCGRLALIPEALDYAARALSCAVAAGDRLLEARVHSTFGNIYSSQSMYADALNSMKEALRISEEIGYDLGVARNLSNIGSIYSAWGDLRTALEYRTRALRVLESLHDEYSIVVTTLGIGSIYMTLGDFSTAHEYYNRVHFRLQQRHLPPVLEFTYYSHKAVALFSEGRYDESVACNTQALAMAEEHVWVKDTAVQLTNLARTYIKTGSFDEAYRYYYRAFEIITGLDDENGLADVHGGLGELFATPEFSAYSPAVAEEHLLKCIASMEKLHEQQDLYRFYSILSELYKGEGRFEEALQYQSMYYAVRDEVRSVEARKAAELVEQEQLSAKRERELMVERTKAKATEEVLFKVLPVSVAERLINNEQVADYFECISILFADVVGFTPIAARMKADDTLRFLNFIFAAFDRIMERHGCQKIKTMGDGYMAVCGAPQPTEDHAELMALAALDLMNDIVLPSEIRRSLPDGSVFHLRIGLHCGPAFAGIVGEKGFVYDVYSDAVNLAARMESHGEPGKIHCSEDFVRRLTQRSEQFHVIERGLLEIKGKGMMRTYFLEKA